MKIITGIAKKNKRMLPENITAKADVRAAIQIFVPSPLVLKFDIGEYLGKGLH